MTPSAHPNVEQGQYACKQSLAKNIHHVVFGAYQHVIESGDRDPCIVEFEQRLRQAEITDQDLAPMVLLRFLGNGIHCNDGSDLYLGWHWYCSWTLRPAATYDRQPLHKWPYSIQLNTVLSTFGTVVKGFMLVPVCASLSQLKWLWYSRKHNPLQDFQIFDVASRGPWGAARLLVRLRFWHLASIGGVVTLLALTSDAIVQQSVSYPVLPVSKKSSAARVPYTQGFTQYALHPMVGHISASRYWRLCTMESFPQTSHNQLPPSSHGARPVIARSLHTRLGQYVWLVMMWRTY